MLKMTENEAIQYVKSEGLNWDDAPEVVRECSSCDSWVLVDEFCGSDDCCDECA